MIKVKIEYDYAIAGTSVYIYQENGDGSITLCEPLELTFTRDYDLSKLPEPTFRFNRKDGHDFLQGLAQALAENGFKPDELKAYDKQVEATKYHLEDMRSLVFKKK